MAGAPRGALGFIEVGFQAVQDHYGRTEAGIAKPSELLERGRFPSANYDVVGGRLRVLRRHPEQDGGHVADLTVSGNDLRMVQRTLLSP